MVWYVRKFYWLFLIVMCKAQDHPGLSLEENCGNKFLLSLKKKRIIHHLDKTIFFKKVMRQSQKPLKSLATHNCSYNGPHLFVLKYPSRGYAYELQHSSVHLLQSPPSLRGFGFFLGTYLEVLPSGAGFQYIYSSFLQLQKKNKLKFPQK